MLNVLQNDRKNRSEIDPKIVWFFGPKKKTVIPYVPERLLHMVLLNAYILRA